MYRPSGWDDRLVLAFEKSSVDNKLIIAGAENSEYKLKD
jgi:hypothetical protein